MPCHDCGIYSKHLCIVYHDAFETILCMLYNAVFVYLYLYGLWPEMKSYYIILLLYAIPFKLYLLHSPLLRSIGLHSFLTREHVCSGHIGVYVYLRYCNRHHIRRLMSNDNHKFHYILRVFVTFRGNIINSFMNITDNILPESTLTGMPSETHGWMKLPFPFYCFVHHCY